MNTTVIIVANELKGADLDYFVAIAMGYEKAMIVRDLGTCTSPHFGRILGGEPIFDAYQPSNNWVHCGEIIKAFRMNLTSHVDVWRASHCAGKVDSVDPLQAICRLVVTIILGESFHAELVKDGNRETYRNLKEIQ